MTDSSKADLNQTENIENKFVPEAKPENIDILEKIFSFAEETRLNTEDAKTLYAFGYAQYQKAHYREASETFLYLVLYSPADSKNLMALGACFQAESEFEKAIPFYKLCFELTPVDPYIHFYTAECLLRTGQKTEALQELERTIEISRGSEQFDQLLNKAGGMAELLKKAET